MANASHAKIAILGALLLIVLSVSAQDEGGLPYKIIYNCFDEGYSGCEYVVGQVYSFEAAPAGGMLINFPENPIPRQLIDCAEENAVTLAAYKDGAWVTITSEVISKPEGIQVQAFIDTLGNFTIIKKVRETGFTEEGQTCTPLACGEYGAFITEPNKVYKTPEGITYPTITEGTTAKMDFCGMLAGCIIKPDPDGNCDQASETELGENHCMQGIAPDCAEIYGSTCVKEDVTVSDSCCYPEKDNKCDADCYVKKDDKGFVTFATDPDCYTGIDDLNPEVHPLETMDLYRETPPGCWGDYNDININATLNGPMTFYTDGSGTSGTRQLWYGRFKYQDFNGDWHYLMPAAQLPNDPTLSDFVDSTFDNDIGGNELGTFWRHPAVFMQSRSDGEKPQYWFSNTPVKKISFQASRADDNDCDEWDAGDSDDVKGFRVKWQAYKGAEFDPDNDGVSSGIDCNDNNNKTYPGAPELCDGIDNNCNSYIIKKDAPGIYENSIELTYGKRTSSYMMPCDGYITYEESLKTKAYLEVKRIDAFTARKASDEKSSTIITEESFSIPGFFGFDPAIFNNDNQKIAEFFRYGDLAKLPKEFKARHQALFYGGKGTEDDDGVIEVSDVNCILGMEDSCTCITGDKAGCTSVSRGVDRTTPVGEKASRWWKRDNNGWQNDIYKAGVSGDRGKNVPLLPEAINKIELLKGDILKMWVSDKGQLKFDVYCYEQGRELSKDTVDEDIGDERCETKKLEVKVCKSDDFSSQERKCYKGQWCTTEVDETTTSTAESAQQADKIIAKCDLTATEDMNGGEIFPFYTYVCAKDTTEPCYKFYEGNFQVCATKEEGTACTDGADNDCDGIIDYEDSDCKGVCIEGDCEVKEQKWCKSSEWTSRDYSIQDYRIQCGSRDSTQQKTCKPEEPSCEGGCLEGACDNAANLLCSQGSWTGETYASRCKQKDPDLSATCDAGACDTQQNKTCFGGKWVTVPFGDYCLRDCGKEDYGCLDKRTDSDEQPPCQEGACDIYENKYCTAEPTWTGINYCSSCGARDSDCGAKACTEQIADASGKARKNCDYANGKYCKKGQWTSEGYCSLEACGLDSASKEICACIPTAEKEEGTACTDGADNDCDGFKDCADQDCPKNLPGCACTEGEQQECCADPLNCLGLCAQQKGTQKCANGIWGSCEEALAPSAEACNGEDDSCDGSIDEGCGDCQTGQTRNCGIDKGACSAGVQECSAQGLWSICFGTGYKKSQPETCDGVDNDCNGQVDEICSCEEGATQACGSDKGECRKGNQTCANGQWGVCLGGKDQIPEVGSLCFDAKDNDCDGKIDSTDENCGATPAEELKPTCYDGTKNQDEEGIDCGGSNCPPCDQVTCNDRQKNGDEDGIDCGGSKCPTCKAKKTAATAETPAEEMPAEEVTEERPGAAPEKGFPWLYIIGGIVILGGILLLLYNKFGKGPTKAEFKPKAPPERIYPGQTTQPQQAQKPIKERITKTKEESKLEKSFEETKKLFK